MQVHFSIEYFTHWGERLVLRYGKRRIAMQWSEGGVWTATLPLPKSDLPAEYTYEVECDGKCIRPEWRPHTLLIPDTSTADTLHIRDCWIDMPSDTAFYASAFTESIFRRTVSGKNSKDSNSVFRHQLTGAGYETTCNSRSPQGGAAACRLAESKPKNKTINTFIRVTYPAMIPGETLAVAGSGSALGDWTRIIPMDDSRFPEWTLALNITEPFEYKFLIADRKTGVPIRWEEGPNRIWSNIPGKESYLQENSATPRIPDCRWRGAGTAIPVFSLRSETDFGVGEFYDLKPLIDWAVATGQQVIQLLPINDTTMNGTWEDSYPYNANSSFALHPQYIHLPAAGVEQDDEYRRLREELNALPTLDYEQVNIHKQRLLRQVFSRNGASTTARRDYKEFIISNTHWLTPYAAFCTLRDEFHTPDFTRWGDFARYDEKTVAAYCRRNRREIAFHCFVQYHLHTQLSEVAAYARSRGVVLKGDLPIGISRTSADAWVSPHLFHMDSQAGAPPDAFAAEGQNWGFPTYDWERMERDGFAWWRLRLKKMSEYFDTFRIDHILGFFRIWEIPLHSVRGLLGHFNPALPYSADELRSLGFDTSSGRYITPEPTTETLSTLFGEFTDEVRATCLKNGCLLPAYGTQRQVAANFPGNDIRQTRLREGLMTLLEEVLFVEDPRRKGFFHPRIAAQSTAVYKSLDPHLRDAFDRLYEDFFYRRHNDFWRQSALRKLPALLSASGMLACGEDLGMIPESVPATMRELQILSLEIQRMPKSPHETFAVPAHYPYLSVCTTSTHDMNPLRAWWKEDPALSARFYHEVLGLAGDAPRTAPPELCRRIVAQHLASPAMLTILPLQDWLSIDENLRLPDPAQERINIPAASRHYWRYRMHLTVEELLRSDAFNDAIRELTACRSEN